MLIIPQKKTILRITALLCFFIFEFSIYALSFNEVQFIGTHNSYKKAVDPKLMRKMRLILPNRVQEIDYKHLKLSKQLQLKIRQFELDVYLDPNGGHYSTPYGERWAKALSPKDFEELKKPGPKVFHIQDIDYRSQCINLKECLTQLVQFSNNTPNHLPIMILIEMKDSTYNFGGKPIFQTPIKYNFENIDTIDRLIRNIIPSYKLLTPDDLRGKFDSVRSAIINRGWPTLNEVRGKFIFTLDNSGRIRSTYQQRFPNLKNAVMFTASNSTSEPTAAIFRINYPSINRIQALVKEGFMVRTRADASTLEARKNDKSRMNLAIQSGAQWISTDYPFPEPELNNDYQVRFNNGDLVQCNQVLRTFPCEVD